MELVEIAPDVFACLQPDLGIGWSNNGFVAKGGGLVVDTMWDLPKSRDALALYGSVSPSPPRRLVNTHHNGDHCWGNQIYAELGTEIIGHRLCAAGLSKDVSPSMMQALSAVDDPGPELADLAAALRQFDFDGIELVAPTTLVEDELVLDLDGTEARVIYVGPAHTAGDVIVHLPEPGVVFTGDILFHECTPIGWEGTTANWAAALDLIESLEPDVVVPGHGPLATVEGVRALRDYLTYVYAEASRHHAAGLSVIDAAKKIELGPFAAWTEPQRLAWNVARAYRELDGGEWDEIVDVMGTFSEVAALKAHYEANA